MSLPALFREAARQLDLQKLIEYYWELDFLYPFHQTIGFFLDTSGQKKAAQQWRDIFPPTNRFFVDKTAKTHWNYNEIWQVHYPRGLLNDH